MNSDTVYKFIVDYKLKHNGNSPSYEDIMFKLGISSKSTVKYYLDELRRKGLVEQFGVKSITVKNVEVTFKE